MHSPRSRCRLLLRQVAGTAPSSQECSRAPGGPTLVSLELSVKFGYHFWRPRWPAGRIISQAFAVCGDFDGAIVVGVVPKDSPAAVRHNRHEKWPRPLVASGKFRHRIDVQQSDPHSRMAGPASWEQSPARRTLLCRHRLGLRPDRDGSQQAASASGGDLHEATIVIERDRGLSTSSS